VDRDDTIITAALLVIGDEILSGRTTDRNIAILAKHLTAIGIRLSEVRVVPDIEAEIVAALNALRDRFTYVFTTGGIGPTHDDITADSIAKAFGVAIDVDPRAVALMKPHYDRRNMQLTPSRLRMARIPEGADLIANAVSIAPGFMLGNVIVMAGVPAIMEAMLNDVTPRLRTGAHMLSATLPLDRPEGDIAATFAAHQAEWPDVIMGSYPVFADGRFRTELVLRATDPERLRAALEELKLKLSIP
jgi:molybdenum cofactor synthesis domain-containing protein